MRGRAIIKCSASHNDAAVARVKAKLREQGARVRAHEVKTGIAPGDGAKPVIKYTGEEGDQTLAYVALAHEYGAGVPERSWFRSWFDQNAERLRREMTAAMRAEARGNTTAVELAGVKWAAELRAWITTGAVGLAPLAESTRRQRTRAGLAEGPPLFAIGQIVAAIKASIDGKVVE